MKTTKHLLLLFSAFFLVQNSWSANDAGLPGEFLEFGVGARALGMGRAFTGVADDVDSIYFNPAGLATFRASQLTFQHANLPVDGAHQYVAYSQPIYTLGSFGVGIVNLDGGDVPRIDINATNLGSFSARETAYLAAYGHRFHEKFSLGGTLKMAEKSVDGRSERGFGADIGSLFNITERFRVGAALRNALAPEYKYQTDTEEFPTIFRTGASYTFFDGHLLTAMDLSKTIGTDQSLKYHFGVEGFVIRNIFLRAGYDDTEIATGVGIRWKNIQFDYAGGFQDIGFINRFALKVFFGGYEVDVKASPTVFSPVGFKNKVTFNISTANRDRIVKWIMSIRNAKDEVVRSFQGFNEPPSVVEWDGRDANGEVVDQGRYSYRMFITDSRGKVEKTPIRSLRVVAPTPFEIDAK